MREELSAGELVSLSLEGKYAEKARRWKGDEAGYVAKHMWLTKHYDKGDTCENCGTTNASRLEWANVSGLYLRERSDYIVLCPSCHRKMDLSSTHCKNGHEYTAETTCITKQGWRDCRVCRRESSRRYRDKLSKGGFLNATNN